jgi:pimeloyl-ACP methyl ester carboxylesterase
MKFLFEDQAFSFETLRTTGFAEYSGAQLGEVVAAASRITDGDEDSWLAEWSALGRHAHGIATDADAAGHRVIAREAYLRASNYYRNSEFFLRVNPATNPDARELSRLARDTFALAIRLFDAPVERIAIPYEDATLPGYLFLVDDSGIRRPTIVYNNGFDSTLEEAYFAIAAAALRRGYNVLAFDGPGQGEVIREQGLTFRPDWETVITPVVDYAVTRSEIQSDALTLFGYSLGGYLVARAAAFEHRIHALILDDGFMSFTAAYESLLPAQLMDAIREGRDAEVNAAIRAMTAADTTVRWVINNGMWVFGVASPVDYLRRVADYTLVGIADKIIAPTLIMEAENDLFFKGQPQALQAAMTAPTTLVTLTEHDGAGELPRRCHRVLAPGHVRLACRRPRQSDSLTRLIPPGLTYADIGI